MKRTADEAHSGENFGSPPCHLVTGGLDADGLARVDAI